MTESYSGKVALVNGGASGIGRAAAQRFAQEGAKVVRDRGVLRFLQRPPRPKEKMASKDS